MEDKEKLERNRPAEDGRKHDPDLRDESAAQPGASTMSSSPTDDANQHLTQTAGDSFRGDEPDTKADRKFDEEVKEDKE